MLDVSKFIAMVNLNLQKCCLPLKESNSRLEERFMKIVSEIVNKCRKAYHPARKNVEIIQPEIVGHGELYVYAVF